ncbi:MAG: hypothetical protein E7225_05300 [Clostridiales bacterium]|nr:hypothetical protein [Clostridiales bacterium]
MKKRSKIIIFIYLILVICLAVVIYVVPKVTGILTSTVVIDYGNLSETDRQKCYFIRDEEVYLAGTTGNVNYYFEDGVKVREGTTILSLVSSGASMPEESEYADLITKLGTSGIMSTDYISKTKGVVGYYVDGFESYFTPENILSLNHQDVSALRIGEPVNLTRETAYRGEPLFKIAENEKWYITCWVGDGNISKYVVGNEVVLALPLGELEATITNIVDKGSEWQVVFETDRYYEDFTKIRMIETDIITSDYSGIIIPNKSIATIDGEIGVYVKTKTGDFSFVPINIKASDGEYSAVSESYFYDEEGQQVYTVDTYDEILKNPKDPQ